MVDSQDEPFAFNPYVAPEMHERGVVDRPTEANKSVWKWLVATTVVEAAMTLVMVTLHSSSPRVAGLNVFAIANLFLNGVLSIILAWLLAQHSSQLRGLLIAQFANLLIWLTFGIIIHLRFGIHWSGEGSLLLTSSAASAILALISSVASRGAFRSRSSKQTA